jgi:hypothetical protein
MTRALGVLLAISLVTCSVALHAQEHPRDACLEAAAASSDHGPRALMRAYVGGRADEVVPLPRARTGLTRWLAQRLRVSPSALHTLPATGRRGAMRWTVRTRRTAEGTTTYVRTTRGGDCPGRSLMAILHDGEGRLLRYRHVTENCEYVDASIEEDVLRYDAEGALREVIRTTYTHPVHVESLEDQHLTPEVALQGGTMPPQEDPPTRCTVERTSEGDHVVCGDGLDPVAIDATCAP